MSPATVAAARPTGLAMRRSHGRLLLSFVATVEAVAPYLADWNETHISNPAWSPHAKFHVGHTMLLGTVLGGLSLRYLWRRTGDPHDNLRAGAQFAAAYWVAQAGAILVPGAAVVDPEFADRIPTVAGVRPNQLVLDALLLLLVAVGYQWAAGSDGGPDRHREPPRTVDPLSPA